MTQVQQLTLDIAASIFLCPCTENELMERDFLKNYWLGNIQRLIMRLEKDAIYYKGETMFIYKKWAKKNLKGYELDFKSQREKDIDSMTDFAKNVYGL